MATLDQLRPGVEVDGLSGAAAAWLIAVQPHGPDAATLTFADPDNGAHIERLLFRDEIDALSIRRSDREWVFDGDGAMFRRVAEARRIQMAHLFDPRLAVHLSSVEPLPHQLAAVYDEMLPRRPLRFLLADDPGAGKTIMAGLLIRELILRRQLSRCLIAVPANLAFQWQDELRSKFHLDFDIVGRDQIAAAEREGANAFDQRHLAIGRIDQLKQPDNLKRLKRAQPWDLVVIDEAHKLSARWWGDGVRKTARYELGETLSANARDLLLMTATPHNGDEEAFQLFMQLLDRDRFHGRYQPDLHRRIDAADLMRRALKEEMTDFDGRPLFPERRASTVAYELSDRELDLYEAVTAYVKEEMNRADRFAQPDAGPQGKRRRNAIGFALTVLQRRLASSPAAIHESLQRRRKRLEQRLADARADDADTIDLTPSQLGRFAANANVSDLEADIDEDPESEEAEIVDLATASRTTRELRLEVRSLRQLERQAKDVRHSGQDRKWDELRRVLGYPEMFDPRGRRRKLLVFTEHLDTLSYLVDRIAVELGSRDRVAAIHGQLSRAERQRQQSRFLDDTDVYVLVATDAAGEGVNLQRAHLMVNYDLPWNPNRIEQRFGRIHRFGQREVCHLWNLVARQTREGAVYERLFEKLDQARASLGGKVFDVLGRAFEEVALRDLLRDALDYNDSDSARRHLRERIDHQWDADQLAAIADQHGFNAEQIGPDRLRRIRRDLDRADAQRLAPHAVELFFLDAFQHAGGTIRRREGRRHEIARVPQSLRRDPSVQRRYDRVRFDRGDDDSTTDVEIIEPGHPLLTALVEQLAAQDDVLRRGAILIDRADDPDRAAPPRLLAIVESELRDGGGAPVGHHVHYVESDPDGRRRAAGPSPHLDYDPPDDRERAAAAEWLASHGSAWLRADYESAVCEFAAQTLIPPLLADAQTGRRGDLTNARAAVRDRLTKAIAHWDQQALDLADAERAGQMVNMRPENARQRADLLESRLQTRLQDLESAANLTAADPHIVGACLILPQHLVAASEASGAPGPEPGPIQVDTDRRREVELAAMRAVMTHEREHGRAPEDVSAQNLGWDIESVDSAGNRRFIEVKGRTTGADTITLTRNEWLRARNLGPKYLLAIVFVDEAGAASEPRFTPSIPDVGYEFSLRSATLKISDLEQRHYGEAEEPS